MKMWNVSKKIILLFVSSVLATCHADASEKTNLDQGVKDYLKHVAEDLNINVAVIFTREKYNDDGSIQQVDSLSFSGRQENENFNLSSLRKSTIENLVTDGENQGVLLSLYQSETSGEESNTSYFDTEDRDWPETAAARVSLDEHDLSVGMQKEVADTLELAENYGAIEFLEYFKDENIKRNKTMIFYPKRIVVITVEKMSAKMEQEAVATVQKAYKIDTDKRAPIIATLFDKKFPKYYWQVLVNATHYWIDENDAQLVLKVGADEYDILGIKN